MVGSANNTKSSKPIPSSHYKSLQEYFQTLVDCGLCERVEPELEQQLEDFCTRQYAADQSSIASGADPATSIADLSDIATSQLPSTPGRISHSLLQEKMKDPAIMSRFEEWSVQQLQHAQPQPRPQQNNTTSPHAYHPQSHSAPQTPKRRIPGGWNSGSSPASRHLTSPPTPPETQPATLRPGQHQHHHHHHQPLPQQQHHQPLPHHNQKQQQQWQPPRPENLGDLPLNDECQRKYEHLQRLQRRHDTALRELVQVQGEMVTASLDFLHLRNRGACLESPVYMDGGGGGGGGGHARARDNGDVDRFRGGGGFGQSRSYKKRGRGGRGENGEPSSTGGNFQRQ
ncbi:hypothetical protein LY76DRAFT_649642 [Colletotrichum caudatum]|nr:hypothetical protein LY76DRAFT_649642 [Colletotrichum caudatum]